MIDPLKQKVIKNNKGLETCHGQALIKIGHKILIANPIRMFLVEISGPPIILSGFDDWPTLRGMLLHSSGDGFLMI